MKALFIIPVAFLALAGCKTTNTPTPSIPGTVTPAPQTEIGKGVAKVQDAINKTCGYVVKYQSIINLAARFTGSSGLVDVNAMVNEVCAALTKPTMSRSKNRAVTVRGVRVELQRK
jgi:hypothetical protein